MFISSSLTPKPSFLDQICSCRAQVSAFLFNVTKSICRPLTRNPFLPRRGLGTLLGGPGNYGGAHTMHLKLRLLAMAVLVAGFVDSEQQKLRAIEVTRGVPGVRDVRHLLVVKYLEKP